MTLHNGDHALSALIERYRRNNDEAHLHGYSASSHLRVPEWQLMLYEQAGWSRLHRVTPYILVLDTFYGMEEGLEQAIDTQVQALWTIIGEVHGWMEEYVMAMLCESSRGEPPFIDKSDVVTRYVETMNLHQVNAMLGTTLPFMYGKARYSYTGSDKAVIEQYGILTEVWAHEQGAQMARISGHYSLLIQATTIWMEQPSTTCPTA